MLFDPVETALENFLKLLELREVLSETLLKGVKVSLKGVFKKLSSFPTLVTEIGLENTLLLYSLRTEPIGYRYLLYYFTDKISVTEMLEDVDTQLKQFMESEFNEKVSSDKKGYTTVLALNVAPILIVSGTEFYRLKDLTRLMSRVDLIKLERVVTIYSQELKKLSESVEDASNS